ncbi:hypothetical protein M405DRAFT_205026 [Rhizopogon salebrosus TDB-379]|nr:hypothetical protein M405DRAFT_205026 [Rhizopogon salebrosus TDB-379]
MGRAKTIRDLLPVGTMTTLPCYQICEARVRCQPSEGRERRAKRLLVPCFEKALTWIKALIDE